MLYLPVKGSFKTCRVCHWPNPSLALSGQDFGSSAKTRVVGENLVTAPWAVVAQSVRLAILAQRFSQQANPENAVRSQGL